MNGYTITYGRERVGQGHALARAWKYLSGRSFRDHDHVFWCEDDFCFERDVDLLQFREVLEQRPYLLQMALLRQPWFAGEVKAGGIVERDPDEYTEVVASDRTWLEHRMWFTLNPNLFPRALCSMERPTGHKHEWHVSRRLCNDEAVRFGLWGDGTPWVRHTGEKRVGRGY